jgi:outer membrane protein assembly factor BamB
MKIMKITIIPLFIFCLIVSSFATDNFSQWRGPNRDGQYPETNLLKKWPKNGPELLWQVENIGEGHSSVAVANGLVYVAGMIKKEGFLFCFNMDGKLLWKSSYGDEWFKSYPGSRSTPTIIGNNLYLISGNGRVVCFDALTGKERWAVDMLGKFDGENIEWGIAESPVVDGDRLICTPGGPSENIVALNRFTGETIWTSKGNGDLSAYCSPLLVEHNNERLIVTMTEKSILGIDAENGDVYWRVPQKQEYGIHADTPLYHDGKIFCISGSDNSSGSVVLDLSSDGKKVSEVWRHRDADNLIGGVILHNGYIYGSRYEKDEWFCVDWRDGKLQYVSESFGGGSIISADGLLYCYSERGMLGLVMADANNFEVISSFKIKSGKGPHWSHPVINQGRLYIRHGGSLMVFDIIDR